MNAGQPPQFDNNAGADRQISTVTLLFNNNNKSGFHTSITSQNA